MRCGPSQIPGKSIRPGGLLNKRFLAYVRPQVPSTSFDTTPTVYYDFGRKMAAAT